MVLLTLHGFGFYGVWLYTAEYTRGLVWDRTGEHSPISACISTGIELVLHRCIHTCAASSARGEQSVWELASILETKGMLCIVSTLQRSPA